MAFMRVRVESCACACSPVLLTGFTPAQTGADGSMVGGSGFRNRWSGWSGFRIPADAVAARAPFAA
eukprot:5767537-Alexandrium_andersonii.AAC.1